MSNISYEISPKDLLLVIDVQNDFCPNGALGVNEGNEIIDVVNRLGKKFKQVVLSQDWHPADHKSFASNHVGKSPFDLLEMTYGPQVLWPDHCVQGTKGAEFHIDLDLPNTVMIVRKGYRSEIDSYSAFFENDHMTATGLDGFLKDNGISRVFLVGLATDFCVSFSAIDAAKLGYDVVVVDDACRAIDMDGSLNSAYEAMTKSGVKRCHSKDIT